jgi:hypothetical protein
LEKAVSVRPVAAACDVETRSDCFSSRKLHTNVACFKFFDWFESVRFFESGEHSNVSNVTALQANIVAKSSIVTKSALGTKIPTHLENQKARLKSSVSSGGARRY